MLDMRRREGRPDRACGVGWLALGAVLLALGCSPPARAVAAGPPTSIALDVDYFLPVLGTWMVRGFAETLAQDIAFIIARSIRGAPPADALDAASAPR